MKIGITGHTQGIGRSLYNIFQSNGHDVLGFCRANGFDISDKKSREDMLELSNDCDIFINNAYHPFGQFMLLTDIVNKWTNTNKIVVNISSFIVYKDSLLFREEQVIYKDAKIKINNFIKNYTGTVKILNVIPSLVNTNFYLIPTEYDRSKFIDPDRLADLVYNVCKHSKDLFIKELTVYGNIEY